MIFLLIGFFIMVVAWRNYKKGFLAFLIFNLFLTTNITVISVPGLPLLSLNVLMPLYFIGLYYIRRKQFYMETLTFPFGIPFKLLLVSWFFSTLFSLVGFGGALSAFIKNIADNIILAWLVWKFLSPKDIPFLIKWLTLAFLVICLYGFYEKAVKSNPLQDYEMTFVDDSSRAIDFQYSGDAIRGQRVQSVFEHPIGGGINWALFIVMSLAFYVKYKVRLSVIQAQLTAIVTLMSILCVFLTNSRGPIVFLFIGCMSLISFRNKRFFRLAVMAVIALVVLAPFLAEFTDIIMSLVLSKAQENIGGSDAELRFEQLAVSIAVMMQSPIVGLGYKFEAFIDPYLLAGLLGLESMWFRILTTFGLLGVVTNCVFAYYSIIKIPRYFKSLPAFYVALAYWVVASLTSVPGMLQYFYFLVYILFLKLTDKYRNIIENKT